MPVTSPSDDQALLDFRNATNFRSVKRSDPHVAEILETSVYSVIYQWDEGSDKWEKKNQEGPLFVVRRDKSPEYSLYMLNRQTVKNPAIPLVPGEMKMTVLDQQMMQVARRGDKTRTAVWFSEGAEMMEQFRRTILAICGEPSKRPDAVASPAVAPPRAGVASQEDGLAKLFAGIMVTPAIQSPSPAQPAPTLRAAPAHAQAPSIPTPPSLPTHKAAQAVPSSAATPAPAPVPSPAAAAALTGPTPASAASPSDKARTADDLLMSILGLGSPAPAAPGPRIASQQPQQQQNASPHRASPVPQQQQQQRQQRPPQTPTLPMGHYANGAPLLGGSHPQLPGVAPPSGPGMYNQQVHGQQGPTADGSMFPGSSPNQYTQHQKGVPQNWPVDQPGQQRPQDRNPKYAKVGEATYAQTTNVRGVVPANAEGHVIGPGANWQSGQRPGPEARAMMGEAVVDGVMRKEQAEGGRLWGIGLGMEERKMEFRRRLTDLILSDQEFVDGLWKLYIERMVAVGAANG